VVVDREVIIEIFNEDKDIPEESIELTFPICPPYRRFFSLVYHENIPYHVRMNEKEAHSIE